MAYTTFAGLSTCVTRANQSTILLSEHYVACTHSLTLAHVNRECSVTITTVVPISRQIFKVIESGSHLSQHPEQMSQHR